MMPNLTKIGGEFTGRPQIEAFNDACEAAD
jgi:hypothetical protein